MEIIIGIRGGRYFKGPKDVISKPPKREIPSVPKRLVSRVLKWDSKGFINRIPRVLKRDFKGLKWDSKGPKKAIPWVPKRSKRVLKRVPKRVSKMIEGYGSTTTPTPALNFD